MPKQLCITVNKYNSSLEDEMRGEERREGGWEEKGKERGEERREGERRGVEGTDK